MHCLDYCLIGAILIGSMIAVMVGRNSAADQAFKNSLSSTQLQRYQQVYKERLALFIQGLVIGAVISLGYIFLFTNKYKRGTNACIITGTVMGVAYLYYMGRPKKMMLDYLSSQQQVKLYTQLYKQYRYRSSLGMILGAVGFFLLVWGTNRYLTE
jgi:hypothetical protein